MMKKIFLAFMILLPFFSISQELLTYKSRGRVFNADNEKVKPAEVRILMENNPDALKFYNAGKSKQTWGNVLILTGFSVAAINHYSLLKDSGKINGFRPNRNIPYIIGAGIVILAVPIKIGFPRKIKKSLALMNEKTSNANLVSFKNSSSFILNDNGIGVCLNF